MCASPHITHLYHNPPTHLPTLLTTGAFHRKSPADLLPELQGRFPVRVELKPLGKEDLVKILSQKKFNLLEQTTKLLATEGVALTFTQDGIEEMAQFAQQINRSQQDIGE